MSQRRERFMREAIRLSTESMLAGDGGPFGAVVVRDDEIVGRGSNLVIARRDPTAHAEIVAIRAACEALDSFQLVDCEVFTSCEPCPMCLGAIYWARPRAVWYAATRDDAARVGFDDARIYAEIAAAPGDRRIPMGQVLRDEALEAFDLWDGLDGKIRY